MNGHETFSFNWGEGFSTGQEVKVVTSTGVEFSAKSRLDTEPEIAYFMNGGILHYVLRNMLKAAEEKKKTEL